MRKLMLVMPIFLLLVACGSNSAVNVTVHEVTPEFLDAMCNAPESGCSEWGEYADGQKWCDIYMLPYENYAPRPKTSDYPNEVRFNEVRGHESRHCDEGHFHN